jgi:hypothetical protein
MSERKLYKQIEAEYAEYKRQTKNGAEANCADEYRLECADYERQLRSAAAGLLGSLGGKARSAAKVEASRENGKRGGRPPKGETT